MGTHPIFESDFDCLTERIMDLNESNASDISLLKDKLREMKTLPWDMWKLQGLVKHDDHQYKENVQNSLEHNCLLDINAKNPNFRNTSIVCTIGPVSNDVKTLKMLIDSGMDIARLNFSHGNHEYHGKTIENIRAAQDSYRSQGLYYKAIGIALDTKGPEIRTGLMKSGNSILLKKR